MKYYIYHIPGVKIGCTSQLKIRMRKQGFTEWEILESYRNIYTASKREMELQKEYGLPIDDVPYWKSVKDKNRNIEGKAKGGRIACEKLTYEQRARGGRNTKGNRKFNSEQIKEIRSKYIPRKYTIKQLTKEYNCSYNTIVKIVKEISYLK